MNDEPLPQKFSGIDEIKYWIAKLKKEGAKDLHEVGFLSAMEAMLPIIEKAFINIQEMREKQVEIRSNISEIRSRDELIRKQVADLKADIDKKLKESKGVLDTLKRAKNRKMETSYIG